MQLAMVRGSRTSRSADASIGVPASPIGVLAKIAVHDPGLPRQTVTEPSPVRCRHVEHAARHPGPSRVIALEFGSSVKVALSVQAPAILSGSTILESYDSVSCERVRQFRPDEARTALRACERPGLTI